MRIVRKFFNIGYFNGRFEDYRISSADILFSFQFLQPVFTIIVVRKSRIDFMTKNFGIHLTGSFKQSLKD